MTARIIVVLNRKGGVGKTTVCLSLAGELQRRQYRVLVADCDAQGSALAWALAAVDTFPATVVNLAALRERVHQELRRYLADYDFILVDTPPNLDAVSDSALLVADLALIPLPPTPLSIWAFRAVKALIERARKVNQALQSAIVANLVTRTGLCTAALEELPGLGTPVLATRLTSRVAYGEATLAGTTVSSLGRRANAAALEVQAMTDEILGLLGERQ